MAGLKASSRVLRGGSCLRGSGQTDSMAAFTVRKPTPYLRCKARFDIPARASRRIAGYRSTLDFGGISAPSPRRALPASHRKPPSGVKTRFWHRSWGSVAEGDGAVRLQGA